MSMCKDSVYDVENNGFFWFGNAHTKNCKFMRPCTQRNVLQCVAVFCSVLQRDAVCCSGLQCAAALTNIMRAFTQCNVLQYNELQCVAVCCSVQQCVPSCCNMLQHSQTLYVFAHCVMCCSMFQYVVVCCSVWQCVAVCCSTHKHIASLHVIKLATDEFVGFLCVGAGIGSEDMEHGTVRKTHVSAKFVSHMGIQFMKFLCVGAGMGVSKTQEHGTVRETHASAWFVTHVYTSSLISGHTKHGTVCDPHVSA